MPPGDKFNFCRSACARWLVKDDGHLLVPLYFGRNAREPFSVTVAECRFDGERITYSRHSDELTLKVDRGLVEPSLVRYGGRYYLTLRNDRTGYVTVSEDGLKWATIREWTFDDGRPLGSYNTQQHWLAHGQGLYLVYTRRGADNDSPPQTTSDRPGGGLADRPRNPRIAHAANDDAAADLASPRAAEPAPRRAVVAVEQAIAVGIGHEQ